MPWDGDYEVAGHRVTLFGWGSKVSLQLSNDQIEDIGKDMPKVLKWFKRYHEEIGLIGSLREIGYFDEQYLHKSDYSKIYNSVYATDDDRRLLEQTSRPVTQYAKPPRSKKHGFVYLIRSTNGEYKIGKTKNMTKRMGWFGISLPFKVETIHTIECDDMDEVETSLHNRFADKRLNGEWFALSESDVEEIKSL